MPIMLKRLQHMRQLSAAQLAVVCHNFSRCLTGTKRDASHFRSRAWGTQSHIW